MPRHHGLNFNVSIYWKSSVPLRKKKKCTFSESSLRIFVINVPELYFFPFSLIFLYLVEISCLDIHCNLMLSRHSWIWALCYLGIMLSRHFKLGIHKSSHSKLVIHKLGINALGTMLLSRHGDLMFLLDPSFICIHEF